MSAQSAPCVCCDNLTELCCGRCEVRYCGRECQAAHWSTHKNACSRNVGKSTLICGGRNGQQNWKERLNKAKVLVIGSHYLKREVARWSIIDPNYIGFGFDYTRGEDVVIHFEDENPLEINWYTIRERATEYPYIASYLVEKLNGKKFDDVYADPGVLNAHLFLDTAEQPLRSVAEKIQFYMSIKKFALEKGGNLHIPDFDARKDEKIIQRWFRKKETESLPFWDGLYVVYE